MAAGVYNFKVEQGVGNTFTIDYRDGSGAPKDLTNYNVRGHIKDKMSSCDPVAQFDIEITEPTEGKMKVVLASSALTHIKLKSNRYDQYVDFVYDIELYTENDEEVIRILNGIIQVSPEVTK